MVGKADESWRKRGNLRKIRRRSVLAALGGSAAGLVFADPTRAGDLPRAAGGGQVNFYNWDTYIGETTLADFREATGIRVVMDLFADNEELFAKLKMGNPGYDVIVPTNDFVERMILAELLSALDKTRIPNLRNLDPMFLDVDFDPGRTFSLPYMWGTVGIGYRKSRVSDPPDSWKWLYDSDRYEERIALLGDPGTVIGIALKYLGKSFNSNRPEDIDAAEKLLIAQKPRIRTFARDNGQDLLLSGEVDLAMEWNGDILQIMEEDDDIGYVVPREGGVIWEDALAIPKGAPHRENAHMFMNFLLDAEVGASIADFVRYATPNAAAKALMDRSYLENTAIFPPQEVLERCEPSMYQGMNGTRLREKAWTRILAA